MLGSDLNNYDTESKEVIGHLPYNVFTEAR